MLVFSVRPIPLQASPARRIGADVGPGAYGMTEGKVALMLLPSKQIRDEFQYTH
jgi:hypothetical protein